jgi:hypothetical protein
MSRLSKKLLTADTASSRCRTGDSRLTDTKCLGAGVTEHGRRPRAVRAATLGAAAEVAGVTWDRHLVAAVNGDQADGDGDLPHVAGDAVAFRATT